MRLLDVCDHDAPPHSFWLSGEDYLTYSEPTRSLALIPPGVRESLRSDPSLRSDRRNPYLAADSLPIISTISRHALAHSRHALAQRFMCSSSGNFSHSLPQLSHALAHASHTRTAIGP